MSLNKTFANHEKVKVAAFPTIHLIIDGDKPKCIWLTCSFKKPKPDMHGCLKPTKKAVYMSAEEIDELIDKLTKIRETI